MSGTHKRSSSSLDWIDKVSNKCLQVNKNLRLALGVIEISKLKNLKAVVHTLNGSRYTP
jgi:hypothetical protein